ncbi:MAG: hypothetical protein ACE5D6_04875 [Candidatus Zixiibacteriota bacterium]
MKSPVIVVDSDTKQNSEFCQLLHKNGYTYVSLTSIPELEKALMRKSAPAVIIDIDTVEIAGRDICRFTENFLQTYFFAVSAHAFHPELENAIGHCIYACLSRPIDPDEILFWLESISKNHTLN